MVPSCGRTTSRLSTRTVQDLEQGRSEGTVQTLNRILGVLRLELGVVKALPAED